MADYTGGDLAADHLVVLVHGLWGNPNHMRNVAKALREKHPADKLYILCAQRNSGSFTYDGAELGGERVCSEIQEELHAIEARGGKITKLSMIGYSHGGLVARYAVGLLYAKGILDNLECINFTAFASPFLGVRSPLRGATNHIWNVLGARTLSMSGRQLFMIDNFRNTGRPLLAILADPNSIFYKGLAKFRRRTLYANIIHDRSTVYYTSAIDKTNPYTDLDKVRLNYIPGYEDVLLDPNHPVEHIPPHSWKQESFPDRVQKWVGRIPFALALAVLVPIGVVAYLLNSVVQTVLSSKRIALHEKGEAGIDIADYRPPVLINELREAVEDAYEGLNSSQQQEYLGLSTDDEEETEEDEDEETEEEEEETDEDSSDDHEHEASAPLLGNAAEDKQHQFPSLVVDDEKAALMAAATTGRRASEANILRRERKQSMAGQPTLALTPYQFEMIQALDSLGWRKYRVRIRRNRHSHASIIVRMDKEAFSEGYVVLRHWLNEEFMV